jgi:hypothetical protein
MKIVANAADAARKRNSKSSCRPFILSRKRKTMRRSIFVFGFLIGLGPILNACGESDSPVIASRATLDLDGGSPPETVAIASSAAEDRADVPGLVGYWKLQGDCRDYSGRGNHGVNHGVNLESGTFDGLGAYVEVPSSDSLKLGAGNFTLCAAVHTQKEINDIVGDVLDMYDPALRRGITLCIDSSAGGYQSQGTDRHVYFGIDNARMSDWQDCGRPNDASNYVGNSMTVYKGKLYAASIGAKERKDWAHVYRYEGGRKWVDCGRVGNGRTPGVLPLIVHDGNLYAVTCTYDWTRVRTGDYDPGRVYRYLGGIEWQDCGQPGEDRTLNCIASYKGKLYVGCGPESWGVFVQNGGDQWRASQLFPKTGPRKCFPHAMSVFNGKLHVVFNCMYSFDGEKWTYAGLPAISHDLQTHSLHAYQGKLCAGTWPDGKVSMYLGGEDWKDLGRLGEDGTEVNSLAVYNGKMYGGVLPRSEVCRYDGDTRWTSLKRFYSPEGWTPALPGRATPKQLNEWSRLTSLTIYAGKLFASTGSCTSSILDAPCDVRGQVFSMEAGKCVSFDDDLGSGWKHLAAVRENGLLKLYVQGKLVAQSSPFESSDYDVSTDRPLRIGFGQTDYFAGKIADVRIYNKALTAEEIQNLSSQEK